MSGIERAPDLGPVVDTYIKALVDEAPPLSPRQSASIARTLSTVKDTNHEEGRS